MRQRSLLCVSLCDTLNLVIKSFRHDGLARFFSTGSKAGIQPTNAKKLSLQLLRLDGATSGSDAILVDYQDYH